MVMGRVRATSYVRRTISQPLNKNVSSGKNIKSSSSGLTDTNLIRNKNLHLQLLCNNKTPNNLGHENLEENYELNEGGPFYTLRKTLMGHVTEDLALHTGEIIGGLLNATFGNLMEMIFSIQALNAGLINVVQGTLLGSILSNLLLVLGMSFFAGGLYHHVQKFNEKGATCSTSLLLLSSLAITIPTVSSCTTNNNVEVLLKVSRITAVLIFLTYCLFLLFQLYTHISLFQDKEMTEEIPQLSIIAGSLFLILITILVSVHSEYLINTIEAVIKYYNISENFIGVILLPVVGNATEHLTAVTVAIKNKVDLTMGVAVGSSAQIALFVVPVTVLFGWILNKPMTLAFSPLSSVILVISVIVTMAIVQDGESNWLEGVLLISAYLIVGVVFWFDTS
ncbi:cation/H+ antiporter, putative [Plasmodium malariae]|uniref:Cation/H+ antiporter, putative n=1 Tax=Plasmodium malariae TaxID=5858 RepID=A0A1A8W413_PLAMA|nr:cation/H+ antiporter, putative [Plasmodium malariae]